MATERPILFNGPMVRAILEGKKVQTRRVIKPDFDICDNLPGYEWYIRNRRGLWENHTTKTLIEKYCPYGKPGDRLWVREVYLPDPPMDGTWDYYLFNDGSGQLNLNAIPERFRSPDHCIYQAGWDGIELRWKPSIHMPRWASRITLEITGVRVERLQDISEADAIAEGVEPNCQGDWQTCPRCWNEGAEVCLAQGEYIHYLRGPDDFPAFSAMESFESLWDSINAKRGLPWQANPWVWVVEVKRIEATNDNG